jgi:hypothetical protein
MDAQLEQLKSTISRLQVLYFVLFGASLVLLVSRWSTVLWAISLGSAVICRLYRSSLVNKYNALLAQGRDVPLV